MASCSFSSSPEEAFRHVSERKEELRKVFSEFENKKFTVGRIGATWKDIEEHFKEIEACLQKTFDAYMLREKAFEEKMKSVQTEFEKRDAEISAKERESVARVQMEKDAAVSAILEQKRKLSDERRKLSDEKPNVPDEKRKASDEKRKTPEGGKTKAEILVSPLPKKEDLLKNDSSSLSSNSHKNRDLLKKDSSLSLSSQKKEAMMKNEDLLKKEAVLKKVSSSSPDSSKSDLKGSPSGTKSTAKPNLKDGVSKENLRLSGKLNVLCQNMDCSGLKKFLVEVKKDVKTLVSHVTASLRLCKDPPQFVLGTLQDYFETERHGKQDFSKDDCFAWGVLMEALSDVLQKDGYSISDDVKICAKTFADRWRATLELDGQMNFKLVLEGGNFLQFIAVYCLAHSYNQDELCDMVVKVARRKQTPELIRTLGIANKAPVVIEKLIKDGKSIQAVTFASAFDLLEQFPPAPLLRTHINEAKNEAKAILKSGNNNQTSQKEAIQKELAALKAVANVVKEHKLEKHYNLDYVEKQVAHLEKTKADRKQATSSAFKVQQPTKRQRSNDHSPMTGVRGRSMSPKRLMYAMNDRSEMDQFGRSLMGGYNDQRSFGSIYSSASAGHTSNPSAVPHPYAYASHALSPLGYRNSVRGGPPGSLMDYNYPSPFPSLRGYKPYP